MGLGKVGSGLPLRTNPPPFSPALLPLNLGLGRPLAYTSCATWLGTRFLLQCFN